MSNREQILVDALEKVFKKGGYQFVKDALASYNALEQEGHKEYNVIFEDSNGEHKFKSFNATSLEDCKKQFHDFFNSERVDIIQIDESTPNNVKDEDELKRLYEWLMDENRKSAKTFFTAGWLRNVAKEIEIRLSTSRNSINKLVNELNKSDVKDERKEAIAFGKFIAEHGWKPYSENAWENNDDETASTETLYDNYFKQH